MRAGGSGAAGMPVPGGKHRLPAQKDRTGEDSFVISGSGTVPPDRENAPLSAWTRRADDHAANNAKMRDPEP